MYLLALLVALYPTAIVQRLDSAAIPQDLIDVFSQHDYKFTGGKYVDEPFHYRLFEPDLKAHKGKLPLIVWLHGAGAIELNQSGYTGQLKHLLLIIQHPEVPHEYPFYVLALQMKVNSWYDLKGPPDEGEKGGEQITVLMEILDDLLKQYPIDADRIYLCGVSAGGSGCWELAMRYPDRFAAVAPMGSKFDDLSRAERVAKLPIWAFHSAHDDTTRPQSVRRLIAEINNVGGNAYLTEINKSLHDCWVEAFQQYQLLDWLLSQRRNSSQGLAPGHVPWTTAVLSRNLALALAPVAVVILIVAAARAEVRRKRIV